MSLGRKGRRRIVGLAFAASILIPQSAKLIKAIDVSALSNIFYQNDIQYYDPDGCANNCGSNGVAGLLPGNDDVELVWNGFVKANIPGVSNNPAVISALIGNCMAESGCSPFTHVPGSSYYGLFQTLSGAITGPLESKGISLSHPAWGYPAGEATREEKEKCIEAQIEVLKNDSPDFQRFVKHLDMVKHKSGAEGAMAYADLYTVEYEKCVCAAGHFGLEFNSATWAECNNSANEIKDGGAIAAISELYGSGNYEMKTRYQAADKRRNYANDAFSKYANAGSTAGVSTSADGGSSAIDGSNITYIGDSYSENAKSLLASELPGADMYVKCSKNFGKATSEADVNNGDFNISTGCVDDFSFSPGGVNWTGTHVLKQLKDDGKIRPILVFALGTNYGYGGATTENIKVIMDMVGENTKVVFMTANTLQGKDYSVHNNAVKQAVTDYPGRVAVADWEAASKSDTSLFSSDKIHPTWDGEALGNKKFVELIKGAISELNNYTSLANSDCEGVIEATDGELLASKAMELAWGGGNVGVMKKTSGSSLQSGTFEGWNYYFYIPEETNGSLIAFLHGSGEIGSSLESLKNDKGYAYEAANGKKFKSYMILPQLPSGDWTSGGNAQKFGRLVNKILQENPQIDKSRVHISGFSMGANQLPDVVEANPGMFASAGIFTNAWSGKTGELQKIPTRIFYGEADTSNNQGAVPLFNQLQAAGANVQIDSFPGQTHAGMVGKVINDSDYLDWILRQKRGTDNSSEDAQQALTNAKTGKGNNEYNAAAKARGGSFVDKGEPIISSARAVTLMILESGVDPDLDNKAKEGGAYKYLDSAALAEHFKSSNRWAEVSDFDGVTFEGKLEAGDVLYNENSGHIFIYVGSGNVVEAANFDNGAVVVGPIMHGWTNNLDLGNGKSFNNEGFKAFRLTSKSTSRSALSKTASSASTSSTVTASANPIVTTAIKLSWPEGEDDTQKPNDAYAAAFAEHNIASHGADANWKIGKSCNAYVDTVMHASGADTDFKPGFDVFLDYMASSNKWEEVQASDVQPGDIRILYNDESVFKTGGGHIEIVVEDSAGNLKISSASAGTRYAGISAYYETSSTYSTIRYFRNKSVSNQTEHRADTDMCGGNTPLYGLTEGGFKSKDEAAAALESVYDTGDAFNKIRDYVINTPTGDKRDNCVAFSKWFLVQYTELNDPTVSGNGNELAYNLYNRYKNEKDLKTTDYPVVYSIASWSSPSRWTNHTGIIVGIYDGKAIIAEAAWGIGGGSYFEEYPVDEISGPGHYYVDLTPFMKGSL